MLPHLSQQVRTKGQLPTCQSGVAVAIMYAGSGNDILEICFRKVWNIFNDTVEFKVTKRQNFKYTIMFKFE
jgi:hypothetical protein